MSTDPEGGENLRVRKVRKYLQFYAEIFCLSKPVYVTYSYCVASIPYIGFNIIQYMRHLGQILGRLRQAFANPSLIRTFTARISMDVD